MKKVENFASLHVFCIKFYYSYLTILVNQFYLCNFLKVHSFINICAKTFLFKCLKKLLFLRKQNFTKPQKTF